MKTKLICKTTLTQKQFFLFMVAPFLIGLMITCISLAHAEWNTTDDLCLVQSPQKQGWIQLGDKDFASALLDPQEKLLKTASR